MNNSDDIHPGLPAHPPPAAVRSQVIEATGDGPRIVKLGLVIFLGLVIWWPLLLLTVAFVVPAIVISAVIAAVVAAIVAPSWLLVRRVRGHHPAHQATPLPDRLRP